MHAIVTSGGASHGAYQLGWALEVSETYKDAYEPDLFVGTSVGGLFAAMVAQYSHFADGVAAYNQLWEQSVRKTSDVYKTWWPSWLGYLSYLPGLWKGSLFDASPLQALIQEHFDPESVRIAKQKLILTSVDMRSGKLLLRWQRSIDWRHVYATAAYPLGFPMIDVPERQGTEKKVARLLTDGGVREVTPMKAAIDAGATSIDVVMCAPQIREKWEDRPGPLRLWRRAQRVLDLMLNEIVENDIRRTISVNRRVLEGQDKKHRFVRVRLHRPAHALHGDSLDFTRAVWEVNRARGRTDAKVWIETRS